MAAALVVPLVGGGVAPDASTTRWFRRTERDPGVLVLVAIVIGIGAGAIACAAGLAAGRGHHIPGAAGPPAAEWSSTRHTTHGDTREITGTLGRSTDVLPADESERDVPSAPAHPGMACIVEVELRFADPATTTGCTTLDSATVVPQLDRPSGPEPPVPRPS